MLPSFEPKLPERRPETFEAWPRANLAERTRMRMLRFRVIGFRSVEDSGWVDVDDVTALIGENESGKTNLLIPLWKLNPASEDGAIDLVADYPRDRYHEAHSMKKEDLPTFISADFVLSPDIASEIATMTDSPQEDVSVVRIGRKFGGGYTVGFPTARGQDVISGADIEAALNKGIERIKTADTPKPAYEKVRDRILEVLEKSTASLKHVVSLTHDQLTSLRDEIEKTKSTQIGRGSDLATRLDVILGEIDEFITRSTRVHPNANTEARAKAREQLPKFVYYSTYGNLDSEIYLPHVIDNIARLARKEQIGIRETAKARTLKVLFGFVRLSPQEVKNLGAPAAGAAPEQIAEAAERTKKRDILLSSASTDLTEKFREWWKQGEYTFTFAADGDHFRIWVSDSKRPAPVELEGRSSGLQWFFSFFLVFLVERKDEHKDAILLLDEPGMSLHPLAQRDLSHFFEGLAVENQLIYTSHSPFLLDYDRLDQVKVVWVQEDGTTAISDNLRAAEEQSPSRTKSIYAVHAALGLSVTDTMFIGGAPTIVEGSVDQVYMSLIKTRLIQEKRIAPSREIVFVPAGGGKGVSTVASILAFSLDSLPPVLLDSDTSGESTRRSLEQNLYKDAPDRIFSVAAFTGLSDSEVEDLMPGKALAAVASRLYRTQNEDFDDAYDETKAFLPQIETFAAKHGIKLEKLKWKMDLAKAFAHQVRKRPELIDGARLDLWQRLFEPIIEKIETPDTLV